MVGGRGATADHPPSWPSSGALRRRRPRPRPGRGPGGAGRPVQPLRGDPASRPPAGLDQRRADRPGVADRVGQALRGPRPRACLRGSTGDGDYLTAWEDLVESFCYQVPVGHDTSDVSARRLQNWLYAWQRFAADPDFAGLRPGLEDLLVSRITADAAYLAEHLTAERNHRTLEIYALLLVALAFDDSDGARSALDLLAANAATDIWADGVQRECSTDYHLIVLRSLLGGIANARRFGLDVPPRAAARRRAGLRLRAARAAAGRADPGTVRRRPGRLPDRARARRRAAGPPRPALGRHRRHRRHAARAHRRELPGRRLLHPTQRLGHRPPVRAGAVAGPRRRPARRRRPRALRPAVGGGRRGRPAARRRPRPLHLRRRRPGRLAALVQGHRRAQHGLRGRAGPDAVPAGQAGQEQARLDRRAGRPVDPARPGRAAGRGHQPVLRRGAHPHGRVRRRRLLGRARPAARTDRARVRGPLAPGAGPRRRRGRARRRPAVRTRTAAARPARHAAAGRRLGLALVRAQGVGAGGRGGRHRHRRRPRHRAAAGLRGRARSRPTAPATR